MIAAIKNPKLHDLPAGYTEIEGLDSAWQSGKYIDLGIVPTDEMRIEFYYNTSPSGYYHHWFYADDNYRVYSNGSNSFVNMGDVVWEKAGAIHKPDLELVVILDALNGTITVNGEVKATGTPHLSGTSTLKLRGKTSEVGMGTWRRCAIYQNNVLIHDYYSCIRDNDNKIGMVDKVDELFKTNTSGELTLAGSIIQPFVPVTPARVVKSNNLWDKNNAQRISVNKRYAYVNSGVVGESFTVNDGNYRTFVLPCKPNTTYTVSHNYSSPTSMRLAFSAEYPIVGDRVNMFIQLEGKSITRTSTSVDNYLICQLYNDAAFNADNNVYENMKDTVMVNEGSTALPYEPYGKKIISLYPAHKYELSPNLTTIQGIKEYLNNPFVSLEKKREVLVAREGNDWTFNMNITNPANETSYVMPCRILEVDTYTQLVNGVEQTFVGAKTQFAYALPMDLPLGGRNVYHESNVDKWLNATGKDWFVPSYEGDVLDTPYNDRAGFKDWFTSSDLACIRDNVGYGVYERSGYELPNNTMYRQFTLLSGTEIAGSANANEGTVTEYWKWKNGGVVSNDASNTRVIKRITATTGSNTTLFLRSPRRSTATGNCWFLRYTGNLNNDIAIHTSYAIVPIFTI